MVDEAGFATEINERHELLSPEFGAEFALQPKPRAVEMLAPDGAALYCPKPLALDLLEWHWFR